MSDVYVRLRDDPTSWCRAKAQQIEGRTYKIIDDGGLGLDWRELEFGDGDIVICEPRNLAAGDVGLVAMARARDGSASPEHPNEIKVVSDQGLGLEGRHENGGTATMKITQFGLEHLKHPLKTGKMVHSIVVEARGDGPNGDFVGLGEIRPSELRYKEGASSAWAFAQALGNRLVGQSFDLGAPHVPQAAAMVEAASRDLLGIGDAPLGRSMHRPSRFAFQMALIDLAARASGQSLAMALTGTEAASTRTLRRNVAIYKQTKAADLYAALKKTSRGGHWVRLGANLKAATALGLVNATWSASLKSDPLLGVWLAIDGRWSLRSSGQFVDGLKRLADEMAQPLPVLLEDPCCDDTNDELGWLIQKKTELKTVGIDLRLLLSRSIWGLRSLKTISGSLAHVDLCICPQKVGSVAEIFDMVELYRRHNDQGRIWLNTHGGSTELNAVTLAALTSAIPEAVYFTGRLARDESSYLDPQPSYDDTRAIVLPSGPGLGYALVREKVGENAEKTVLLTAAS